MKLYFVILLIFLFGCRSHKTGIDLFFNKLDNTLSKSEKEEIRECPDVSALTLFVLSKAQNKFVESFKSVPADVDRFLSDSVGIDQAHDRRVALAVAYQRRLNHQDVDFFKIRQEMLQFDRSAKQEYLERYKKEITVQLQIAKTNYNKFRPGDTIQLLFPLEKDGNVKSPYLKNFYYKKDYTDTLFLKCILIKKEWEAAQKFELAHDEFYFHLKIIEARNKNLVQVNKKYLKGNDIYLALYAYGMPID